MTKAMTPFHLLPPVFVKIPTIPAITRKRPIIQIMKPTTQLNSAGLNMNPIPKIRAIIPKIISTKPKAALSPISDTPANNRPIPNKRTKNPERAETAINPMSGKAKTTKPRIIKIIPPPTFFAIFFLPPLLYPTNSLTYV